MVSQSSSNGYSSFQGFVELVSTCIHWTGIVPFLSCELQDINYLVTIINFPSHTVTSVQSLYYLYTRTKQAMLLPCHVSITNVQFSYGSFNCCSTPSSNGKDNGWNHKPWCISQSAYINVTNLGVYSKVHTLMLQILVYIPKCIH